MSQKYDFYPVRYHYGPYIIERIEGTLSWHWRSMTGHNWSKSYATSALAKRAIDEYERDMEDEPASVPEGERYVPLSPRREKVDVEEYSKAMNQLMINNGSRDTALIRTLFNFTLLLADKINER